MIVNQEWLIYLRTLRGELIEMGGKGSGHHGHAGRKGKKGGSAPGKAGGAAKPRGERKGVGLGVERGYFNSGHGQTLVEDIPGDLKNKVIGAILETNATPEELESIKKITTKSPKGHDEYNGCWGPPPACYVGQYSADGTLSLHPTSGIDRGTILHELGHVVTTKPDSRFVRKLKQDAGLQKSLQTARQDTKSRLEAGEVVVGFRDYSVSTPFEFAADLYSFSKTPGNDKIKQEYAKAWGLKSLDDIWDTSGYGVTYR